MPHQVVWEKINVGFGPDEAEETIVYRGGLLPDWVDPFTASTAVSVGAAKWVPEDALDPALTRQAIVPPPVRLPEHPADLPRTDLAGADLISVAGLEDEARELVEEYDVNAQGGPTGATGGGSPDDGKPRGNASEAAWRDYHVAQLRAQGVDEQAAREEAAGLSRDDLRAQYR